MSARAITMGVTQAGGSLVAEDVELRTPARGWVRVAVFAIGRGADRAELAHQLAAGDPRFRIVLDATADR